jgi:hypothetical protein
VSPTLATWPPRRSIDWALALSRAFGVLMIAGSVLNTVLVATRPETYQGLGDWLNGPALLQQLWAATFGDHPWLWVPIIGVGYELAIGLLALARKPRPRVAGLLGIAAFHLALVVMGLWWWALPVLAVLTPVVVSTWRTMRQEP